MRLLGRDREPTVLELSGDARVARWLEVAQFVLEGRLERPCLGGQPDGGVAAAVRPHLTVVGSGDVAGDLAECAIAYEGGRPW